LRKKLANKKFHDLRKYWPDKTLKECMELRQRMSDAQEQRCAICKKHESTFMKRLAIDHNHRSGRVRGLLCYRCNRFQLGKHTIESASAILEYLLRFDLPVGEK
jgi:hypothetical protein